MRTIQLGTSDLNVPAVAVGCMRIHERSRADAQRFINTALELGANFFDHADIYGDGACETLFADAIGMNSTVRERVFLQSKCGIRKGIAFDFSKEYIVGAVDGILKRLHIDYLDVLLLHRPDALMEPEQVAEAFDQLHAAGKVRHFGVSNQNPMQIQLLQNYVRQPLIINQLQFGICHAGIVTSGIMVNRAEDAAVMRDGSVLDFCRLHHITIQPWSPFQTSARPHAVFLDNPGYPAVNAKLDELAERYSVSKTTIALAWILRHPANMQPVVGTTNITRLRDCVQAAQLQLTREEWYAIYMAAGNMLP